MSNSENGWSTVTSASVASYLIPGSTTKLPIRRGDVATVLAYVAEQFHKTVEPLHKGWCWGFAPRKVRGSSTVISNHASATAIDLNAPDHPLGVSGTFTSKQVAAIRKILAFCDGVVRWGGDYSGRKDQMHFEINAGSAAVTRLAAKIRASRIVVASTSISHTLAPGSPYRAEVMLLQRTLKAGLKVDGDFGAATATAVKKYKAASKNKALIADKANPAVGKVTVTSLGLRWSGE